MRVKSKWQCSNSDVMTTLPGEVVKDVAFYDYNAKYIDNQITMAIPASIPEETMVAMRVRGRSPTEQLLMGLATL